MPKCARLSEDRIVALTLLAIYLVLTGWNLNQVPITGPDEPRYAAAARTMIRGGSLIVPEFNSRPRLAKPILFYWLIAGATWTGAQAGLNAVASMRIVPLLLGALLVLGTYRMGVRLFGMRRGVLAAGVLMTMFEFQRLARELVVDVTLAALLIWAWIFFVGASDRIARRVPAGGHLLVFYLLLGLASLTKGPVMAGLFAVMPILAYLIATRQISQLRYAGLWWGAPLALAVGCSWFVAVYLCGHDSLAIFVRENLQRMIGQADHQHYAPFIFYLEVIWENLAPWSVLIPIAIVQAFGFVRRRERWPSEAALLACALAVPFTLLGFAISKRSLYLLPLYPFIALGLACVIERFVARFNTGSLRPAFALISVAVVVSGAVEVSETFTGASRTELESSYGRIRNKIGDRPLVMFGESSNEAVWYLDRPIERLSRAELQSHFFARSDTWLLVSQKVLAREPALSRSISAIDTMQRGSKKLVIACPASSVIVETK